MVGRPNQSPVDMGWERGLWLVINVHHNGGESDPVLSELDVLDVGKPNRSHRATREIAGADQATGGENERLDRDSPILRRTHDELVLIQLKSAGERDICDRSR